MDPPFQDEGRAPDLVRGKASQKLSCLAGEPAADFSCQDDQTCPPMVTCELRIAFLFPNSCPIQRSATYSGTSWPCSPVLRVRAHQSGVDGQLRSSEERESVNDNFEPSRVEVVDGVEVQISVCSNPATSLSANSSCNILEWKTPSAQDPSDWTRRPVVAKRMLDFGQFDFGQFDFG